MPYPLAACRNRNFGVPNPLASVPWVAQWKFNNNGNDSIGANHLTANNSPTFTTGKLGGAMGATQLVAASTQYWSIADNAALSMGDVDFTIAAWVKLTSLPSLNGRMRILSKYLSTGNQKEYVLDVPNDSNVVSFRFLVSSSGSNDFLVKATTFGAPSTGVWYCVIASHDAVNDTLNISVNNGAVDSQAHALGAFSGTATCLLGADEALTSTYALNGLLDNVCIAKSAAGQGGVLTAAQRTAFYAAGVGTELLV